jgi:hypothetical protein
MRPEAESGPCEGFEWGAAQPEYPRGYYLHESFSDNTMQERIASTVMHQNVVIGFLSLTTVARGLKMASKCEWWIRHG